MEERRSPTDAQKQASAWLVRLKSSDVTTTERREFAAWLAASPDNQAAYRAIEATWDRLGAILGLIATPQRSTRLSRRPAVAAATLCVVAALATILIVRSPIVHRETQVLSSAVGQHLSTTLPDGSTVLLNSNSHLSVEFSAAERRVRLGEGEALFNVVSAPNRPFVVETRLGAVQVRGTSFVVRVTDASTRTTVLHGVVEGRRLNLQSALLWSSSKKEESALVATAGEEITFLARSASLASITPATSSLRLAWREGMLAFDGETLAEATAEVTRQTGVSFVFRDPALRDLRVGGYIKANDPEAFSALLRSNLGLSVTPLGEMRVQIARK